MLPGRGLERRVRDGLPGWRLPGALSIACPARFRSALRAAPAFARRLDDGDVDFAHAHHRLLGAAYGGLVWAAHDLVQGRRNDLPGDAEFVLEPAASDFRAAVRNVEGAAVSASPLNRRRGAILLVNRRSV